MLMYNTCVQAQVFYVFFLFLTYHVMSLGYSYGRYVNFAVHYVSSFNGRQRKNVFHIKHGNVTSEDAQPRIYQSFKALLYHR